MLTRRILTTTVLLLAVQGGIARADHEICGDLNANLGLTSADALLALRRAVGQDVELRCAPPAQPLRTGQTLCYNAGGITVSCTGSGQDAAFQNGAGRDLTDNGDGTITDHATGLMWEKLSDDGSIHDADFQYLWIQAFALKAAQLNAFSFAGHSDWRVPNRFELSTLVDLTKADPSVPTVFNTGCAPACTVLTCSCTRPESYWTSSAEHATPANAWSVDFNFGHTDRVPKTPVTFHVRGVRSVAEDPVCGDVNRSGSLTSGDALAILKGAVGQEIDLLCPPPATPPATGQTTCYDTLGGTTSCTGSTQDGALQKGAARIFTDNGNGTITDHATGLTWEKLSDDGSVHDIDNTYTWTDALGVKILQLNAASFGGHNDWRLPNRNELETLVSLAAAEPTTFPPFHTGCAPACTVLNCSCTVPDFYWSSTTVHAQPAQAWGVYFELGYTDRNTKVSDNYFVRAVRGGH